MVSREIPKGVLKDLNTSSVTVETRQKISLKADTSQSAFRQIVLAKRERNEKERTKEKVKNRENRLVIISILSIHQSVFIYKPDIPQEDIMTPFLRYEQETIISFNAGEQTATVYTRDKAVMRKLDGLVKAFPAVYKLTGQTGHDKTYSMPKSHISYRKPRNISEEQREQAREKMLEINSGGKNRGNNKE